MAKGTPSTRPNARNKASNAANRGRNPPRSRPRVRARKAPAPGKTKGRRRSTGRKPSKVLEEGREAKERRTHKRQYKELRRGVFDLISKGETEALAYETGYYVRKPDKIRAFEFAVVCALAAVVEMKRGFAPVWRLLMAVANIVTARSAVTQRFGPGSANLLEALFERAVKKLPSAGASVLRPKLNQFHEVLAQDGTVLQLSPVLAKLFPATRTNTVDAAAKAHVTADVVARRIVDVTVTGERDSELRELYRQDFAENALYLLDLGYTSYDLFSLIVHSKAFLLMRLKENANPTVVNVRHGVKAPKRSIGKKFQELKFCKTHDSFDLDAEFYCWEFDEKVTMRVVGQWNPDTERYHCYVTNLPPEDWTVEELATLYRQRWIIELLMKLLKSSCHLDHIDTSNPDALRTHLYASLLAAVILQATLATAANSAGIPLEDLSYLTAGIVAPMIAIPLLLLWLERELTYDELAAMIFRVLVVGCRDQNPSRTRRYNADLS